MFNMILDRLPTEYEGYLIRTSFRIGIQICLCMKDAELTDEEKTYTALSLLYGKSIPQDINIATKGLTWFLHCGNTSETDGGSEEEVFYWDFDCERLYSSFMVSYGIDLTKEDMHWFKFIALIGSLTKDSALNQAIGVRTYDMKNLKGKARTDMQKLKARLKPKIEYTEEEKQKMAEFDALFNGGEING